MENGENEEQRGRPALVGGQKHEAAVIGGSVTEHQIERTPVMSAAAGRKEKELMM